MNKYIECPKCSGMGEYHDESMELGKEKLIPCDMCNGQQEINLENVKVYQLNEYDGIAAESLVQAKDWYLKTTGLSEDDAFYDYEASELPIEFEVWEDESRQNKQSLKSVIEENWKGEPFLAFSSD